MKNQHYRKESVDNIKETVIDPSYTQKNVCKAIGISEPRLAYWEKLGIFSPKQKRSRSNKFRLFTAVEVNELKFVKRLIDHGFDPQYIKKMLEALPKPHNFDFGRIVWDFETGKWFTKVDRMKELEIIDESI